MNNNSDCDIAIIIPTYNDSKRLLLCLEALSKQTLDSAFRVFVVDNNSTEDLQQVTRQFPFVHYLQEPTPGSYCARNTALKALTTERYIGFTDSDCIPDENWIKNAVQYLKAAENTAIGGEVTVFPKDDQRISTVERYEMLFTFPQKQYVERDGFAVTANLFVTRTMLEKVGEFNTALFSGGDLEFCGRLKQQGFDLQFADNVIIRHPARHTWKQLTSKIVRTVGGSYQQRHTNPASKSLFSWKGLLYGFIPPLPAYKHIIKQTNLSLAVKLKLAFFATYIRFYNNLIRVLFKMRMMSRQERF